MLSESHLPSSQATKISVRLHFAVYAKALTVYMTKPKSWNIVAHSEHTFVSQQYCKHAISESIEKIDRQKETASLRETRLEIVPMGSRSCSQSITSEKNKKGAIGRARGLKALRALQILYLLCEQNTPFTCN